MIILLIILLKYLIFPDPDDILSNDILKYCYNKANKENYDMIRFSIYIKFLFFHDNKNLIII